MTATTLTTSPGPIHRPAGSGAMFLGPGDHYRFLVTGEETGGAYFAMEAIVPPGGGPPPHIHRNEDETFYVVEGQSSSCSATRSSPRGRRLRQRAARRRAPLPQLGRRAARMILTFTPAGIEHFFEETLERALDPTQPPPDNLDEVAARYVAAAPRYGLEFLSADPDAAELAAAAVSH